MKFRVPIKLESEANKRGHWSRGARRARTARQAVTAAGIDAGMATTAHLASKDSLRFVSRWARPPLLPLVVTITRVAPRELDDDNLARSAKAVRDQVAELLGLDDRDKRVTWRYAQERGTPHEYACWIAIEARA